MLFDYRISIASEGSALVLEGCGAGTGMFAERTCVLQIGSGGLSYKLAFLFLTGQR